MLFSVPSIVETKCYGLKNASITISYDAYESHVRDKNGTVSHMIIKDLVIPTGPETRKFTSSYRIDHGRILPPTSGD